MKTLMIAIVALTAPLAALPAAAQDIPIATVRVSDLDLSNPAHVRLLDQRVAKAKESVCGSYAGARDGAEDRIAACRAGVDRQLSAGKQLARR